MTLTPPAPRQAPPHQKFKRLIRNSDYRRIYRQGQRVAVHFLRLYYTPNQIKYCRLGVTVSKRVSKKATSRNWHKRVIKEWFRQQATINASYHSDIVVVAIKSAPATSHGSMTLRRELVQLVAQAFQ